MIEITSQTLRVSLAMLDSLSDKPASGRMYRSGPGYTEPGFAQRDGHGMDARDEAYFKSVLALKDAWRHPPGEPQHDQQQHNQPQLLGHSTPSQLSDAEVSRLRYAAWRKSVEAHRDAWRRRP